MEVFEGKQAGIVTIAESDAVGVVSGEAHLVDLDGTRFHWGEDREFDRVGGRLFFFITTGDAGAGFAKFFVGVASALTVIPADEQGVFAFEFFEFNRGRIHDSGFFLIAEDRCLCRRRLDCNERAVNAQANGQMSAIFSQTFVNNNQDRQANEADSEAPLGNIFYPLRPGEPIR